MNKHRRMLLDEEMKKEQEKAMENARATLKRFARIIDGCSSKLLKKNNYKTRSRLDGPIGDVFNCIYGGGLNEIRDRGLITEYVHQKADELAELVMPMWNTEKWTVESVRRDKEWRKVMELADHIKLYLRNCVVKGGVKMDYFEESLKFIESEEMRECFRYTLLVESARLKYDPMLNCGQFIVGSRSSITEKLAALRKLPPHKETLDLIKAAEFALAERESVKPCLEYQQ